jgi:hypothetical protein
MSGLACSRQLRNKVAETLTSGQFDPAYLPSERKDLTVAPFGEQMNG